MVDMTPAAFIGTMCRTVPFFADMIVYGRLVRGFMLAPTRTIGGATDENHDNGARLDVSLSQAATLPKPSTKVCDASKYQQATAVVTRCEQ